jgi:S-methylmethionine-dependent homocysteine/selenocysteine methylase
MSGIPSAILMEGALAERLKREYQLLPDPLVAWAGLLDRPEGAAALETLWTGYMRTACAHGLPFLATSPTRRANRERMLAAGRDVTWIQEHVDFLRGVRARFAGDLEMYAGGLLGCRGDAYTGAGALPEEEARIFHAWQVESFRSAGADFCLPASCRLYRRLRGWPELCRTAVCLTSSVLLWNETSD